MKNSVLAARPTLATELYRALSAAKTAAYAKAAEGMSAPEIAATPSTGFLVSPEDRKDRPYLGDDPLPFGLEANRAGFEMLVRFARRAEDHRVAAADRRAVRRGRRGRNESEARILDPRHARLEDDRDTGARGGARLSRRRPALHGAREWRARRWRADHPADTGGRDRRRSSRRSRRPDVEISSLLCYNKGGHGGAITDWDAFAEDVGAHAVFAAEARHAAHPRDGRQDGVRA